MNHIHYQGSLPCKQNEIIFTLQSRAARDFWFVKLNASLRTLTFNAEVLSEPFSLVVNKGTAIIMFFLVL